MARSSYDKYPTHLVRGGEGMAVSGWDMVRRRLLEAVENRERCVVVIDCYPGTDLAELERELAPLHPTLCICSDDCAISPEELDAMLAEPLTKDRVFGHMTTGVLADCFRPEALAQARERAEAVSKGLVLVYGVGAALVTEGDILVCADLARWEIQLRYRRGMPNWHSGNGDAPILSKYKRGFFAEWRWADRHKHELFSRLDFVLDTNRPGEPVLAQAEGVRMGLAQLSREPFRTVPYFDPGVWGGQWMKRVCGLDPNAENYAWSFDGVPEENSILLSFDGTVMELPAMDLVLEQPRALLGERVYERFGAEFPIRFDFLDTMGGQNLSLQVHPLKEYIREQFGMGYTQDESYYLLDAGEDACVYLGVKTGVDREAMMADLRRAERGEAPFPAEQYINRFPVKKHDHVLIPAGTIHCSGKDAMVLEISATPYIFTFKLWDWGRVGLDGLPRPIHLDHGEKNIQWDRDTAWVAANLLHREDTLFEAEGCQIEHTGLHETEFIETTRFTLTKPVCVQTGGSVNMLNLVEGESAVVESPSCAFAPFMVHYAETFILPASVGEYILKPTKRGETVKLIRAYVRN